MYTSKKHLNDTDEKQSTKTKIKGQRFSHGNMSLRDFNKSKTIYLALLFLLILGFLQRICLSTYNPIK